MLKTESVLHIFFAALALSIIGIFAAGYKHKVTGYDDLIDSGVSIYRVVSIQPPRSFQVTLYDEKQNTLVGKTFVSRNCNKWRDLKIGSTWELPWYEYRNSASRKVTKSVDATGLCTRLQLEARGN